MCALMCTQVKPPAAGGGEGGRAGGVASQESQSVLPLFMSRSAECWSYNRWTNLDLLGLLSFRDFHTEFDPCSVSPLPRVRDDLWTFYVRGFTVIRLISNVRGIFIDAKLLTRLHCGHSAGLVRAVIPRVSCVRSIRWSRACGQSAGLVHAVNPLVSYM